MIVNMAQIQQNLKPGLAAIYGDYPQYPSQWTEMYEEYESDKAEEQEVEMRYTGLGQIRPEGAPTAMDVMGTRTTTTYVHQWVSLGFTITKAAIINNLYKSHFPMQVKSLRKSLHQTKEILGAALFNNGFSASFPIGDGQPFFSASHPIDGGVVANTPSIPQDLSEGSLEQGIIGIQRFQDVAGLLCQTKPVKLITSTLGQFTANRLLNSAFRVGTPNNDESAIYNMNAVPQGYRVNQFLLQNNAWFLLTDAPNGLKHYKRLDVETDVYTDFSTDNLMCKATECYSFGVSNWRAAWGNNGP